VLAVRAIGNLKIVKCTVSEHSPESKKRFGILIARCILLRAQLSPFLAQNDSLGCVLAVRNRTGMTRGDIAAPPGGCGRDEWVGCR
jgi:hypothetical protein